MAHCNTIFGQMLTLIPRHHFSSLEQQYGTGRSAAFFEALFGRFYQRCQPVSPRHKFKFNNQLYSLDATVVQLCLSLFPWASSRRTKGAIKLHTLSVILNSFPVST
jgi:hypothetical protein